MFSGSGDLFDHVSSSPTQLHWLPIKFHVTFKLATLTHKILHCQQPDYLYQLIDAYMPARDLRSSNRGYLNPMRSRTVSSSRGFRHSSVAVWNSLPQDIRDISTVSTFRRKLKTHLFAVALASLSNSLCLRIAFCYILFILLHNLFITKHRT